MAEFFSTVAGVASLVDVALRASNVLYDSSRYLKDAPQLSQRLRQRIASVKSVLQNLNELLALHRQEQATYGLPDIGTVENEVISLQAVLDTLSTLLPTSSAHSQVRTKVKWILDRKKVTEVIQELDSHKITLTLAVQTFAHRSNSRFHNDYVQRLEGNYRQHEDTTKTFRDQVISGNAGLHADLTNLTHTVSTGQSTLNTKLEDISTTLSRVSVQNNHLVSSTTVTAPLEGLLAPIVRAELRRVIIPTVQQCFEKYRASSDRQLDDIRKTIDEMVQQFSSGSSDDRISSSLSSTPGRSQSHFHQDSVDLINPCDLPTSTFGVSQHQNQPKSRLYKRWNYSWSFHWTIGTLYVTISTSVTKRSKSPDYSISGFVPPQKACRVSVTFTPAICLNQFRGLQLSVANTRDQRGFYQICPFLSTFAVVPKDAEVMLCARSNNVEGLQSLFQRGLAAPSDRDDDGRTPLIYAVQNGNADICRFLLNEGSDTTAADGSGLTLFEHANLSLGRAGKDGDRLAILNMLQNSDGDILEHTPKCQEVSLCYALSRPWIYPESVQSEHSSTYLQWLKQLGLRLSEESQRPPPIFLWIGWVRSRELTMEPENVEFILQTMLEFGADTSARFYGLSPFHYVFLEDSDSRNDTRVDVQRHNRMAIAKALLKHGADLFALSDYGDSVLDLAEERGWTTELCEVLQQTGYDLDEVRLKIFMAKWFFFNPDKAYAMSSTIDSSLTKTKHDIVHKKNLQQYIKISSVVHIDLHNITVNIRPLGFDLYHSVEQE
ncbi:MAG: hypothetical protein Q9215_007709 [Flavoplaca cf. flavocitrina]